jgi:hypothetical protein
MVGFWRNKQKIPGKILLGLLLVVAYWQKDNLGGIILALHDKK